MKYTVAHELRLHFEAPVWEQHCEVRLTPHETAHQTPGDATLSVDPPAEVRRHTDCFGNPVHTFSVIAPHTGLSVRLRAKVETALSNPFDYAALAPGREREWVDESLRAQPRLWDYVMHRSSCTPPLTALAEHGLTPPSLEPGRTLLDTVMEALDWVGASLEHAPAFPGRPRPLSEALAAHSGGCQDFAHLLVAIVRGWGFPARYVMGYRDPGYAEEDETQTLHAWAEVLVPGGGWRGIDPTAHLVADETYVTVALGRDASDALPLKSHWKGGVEPEAPEVVLEVTRDQ